PTSARQLAGGYRPGRLTPGRLPAAGHLGLTRMRVPQHLSGPLAICCRHTWLRFRPGQDHVVAAHRARTRRRHRSPCQGSRRRCCLNQDRARRRSQSAAGRPAVRAAARLSQRRRSVESAAPLGATAARQFLGLFPPRSALGGRAADDRTRRRRRCRRPAAGRGRSVARRALVWRRNAARRGRRDRKSTRLNSSHGSISYAVFCLKKKKKKKELPPTKKNNTTKQKLSSKTK